MKGKTLTPYYGGKANPIGRQITAWLPAHKTFVEVCGGMAGVMMQKAPAHQEVYNDINGAIVGLFRVVRDQYEDLLRRLEMTSFARSEWQYCRDHYRTEQDPVERARMVYVCLAQGFAGSLGNKSWSFGGLKYTSSTARNFYNGLADIVDVSLRLRNVTIENQSWEILLPRWDSKNTLFYIDPPYVPHTRRTKNDYEFEMSEAEHLALLEHAKQLEGKVMISGYANPLYLDMLDGHGWVREDLAAHCQVAKTHSKDYHRTECVWFSPSCRHTRRKRYNQSALFADV